MITFFLSFLLYADSTQSDHAIMKEVLLSYSKQCNYISSIEKNIVRRLELNYKRAQKSGTDEALSCYRDNITAISSANYIYNNLCQEVSKRKIMKKDYMRLFVGVQKYRRGIRLLHTKLNECLKINNVSEDLIVDLNFNRIEARYLKYRLEEIKPVRDFISNRTTYR